jgi:hypothetical protein
MLELTEDALRYNQAPDPRFVVPEKRSRRIGTNGPMGRNSLMADGKGIRFQDRRVGDLAAAAARAPPGARTSHRSRERGISPRPTTT